jgi:tetratricopeptide (TPR) repeat protein
MYIRRTPLGQGNLTFGKKRQRYPTVLIILYLAVLLAALYVFLQAGRLQPKVAAMLGPTPTPTPSPEELIKQAEAAYYAGDLTTAVATYRQIAAMDPQNIQMLTVLSRMLTLNHQYQDALAVAEQIILIAPEKPQGYAAKARVLDWDGQYDSAVVAALRAIEIDSKYAPAHAYLAEAYTDLNQLRLAREQAEMAIQLDPYDVDARRNYAYVLEFYGDYEGAIQQYIQALQLQPNMLELMYGLARNYRGAGQYEESIKTFREIMVRTPNDPNIYVELGKTYYQIRDDDSAQSILEQAVRLVCQGQGEGQQKGRKHIQEQTCPLHTYTEILSAKNVPYYDQADRTLPSKIYMSAWVQLGLVYHTRRNFESELEILEEAIAYGRKHDETVGIAAYYSTASAYYYLDRCDLAVPRAKQSFDIYLERKLDDPNALKNILSIFVLCRDYAGSPYVLTAPGFTNGFPDGYAEPTVTVERGGSSQSSTPAP